MRQQNKWRFFLTKRKREAKNRCKISALGGTTFDLLYQYETCINEVITLPWPFKSQICLRKKQKMASFVSAAVILQTLWYLWSVMIYCGWDDHGIWKSWTCSGVVPFLGMYFWECERGGIIGMVGRRRARKNRKGREGEKEKRKKIGKREWREREN